MLKPGKSRENFLSCLISLAPSWSSFHKNNLFRATRPKTYHTLLGGPSPCRLCKVELLWGHNMKNTLTSVDILALNSSLQKKVHDGLGRKYRRERLWDCFRVTNTVWWKGRLRGTLYFILIIDFFGFYESNGLCGSDFIQSGCCIRRDFATFGVA